MQLELHPVTTIFIAITLTPGEVEGNIMSYAHQFFSCWLQELKQNDWTTFRLNVCANHFPWGCSEDQYKVGFPQTLNL